MKTILFKNTDSVTKNVQPHNLSENLDENLAGWLSQWFLTAYSHKETTDINVPAHTITFYSTMKLTYNPIKIINLTATEQPGESVFWDWNGKKIYPPDPNDINYNEPVYVINVNDRFAGMWIPRLQSLICTDWTHNKTCVEKMQEFWPRLIEAIELKEFNTKTRKAAIKKQQKNLNKKTKTKINITLGCDPEFELFNKETKKIIHAGSISGINNSSEAIGVDGSGNQVELRPNPGSPTEVVRNIKKLIKTFATDYPEFELDAAGHNYPCGGHIHFGNIPTRPNKGLIEILDDFLGAPSLKLSGSARGSYKTLSKWESKPWGFEYRTPPAAIFANPKITKIILKLCKNLATTSLKKDSITYNYCPSTEDYMKIGGLTKLEAEYLLLTLTLRPKTKMPMRVAWGASTASKSSPRIWFRDDWAPQNKEIYNKIIGKLPKGTPNIIIYGLNAERGNVATLPIPGFTAIEHRHPDEEDGSIWIGLPWKLRMETLDKTIATTIINAIIKDIKGGK